MDRLTGVGQNCICQDGTTFHHFLEVAVIIRVMRLIGISFLWLGLLSLSFRTGTKFEKHLIRGLGTSGQFRLFSLSINYSTKPEH